MNILLSSVGRRPYLVRWFKEALIANGIEGKIIAVDLDEMSPARSACDEFISSPRVDDPSYRSWLEDVLIERRISLAVSVNDFEISLWSTFPQGGKWDVLLRLAPETQQVVEDKCRMGAVLTAFGISTPPTWLGAEAAMVAVPGRKYVTKGRFGSASRGLRFVDGLDLVEAVASATRQVTTAEGVAALSQETIAPEKLVVIQEEIRGVEHGLDVVCDLKGNFAGVLARRKISMRAGETDRAESVDPAPFEDVARRLAAAIPHPGIMDVDVILDKEGTPHVIDINPRFGGGYPFSHLAGARVANAYVAWAAKLPVNEEWLMCRPGVIGGKCVEITAIESLAVSVPSQ